MRNKNPILLITMIAMLIMIMTPAAMAKNNMTENNDAGAQKGIFNLCFDSCFIQTAESGNSFSFSIIDNDQNDLLTNTTANESPPNTATVNYDNTGNIQENLRNSLANGNYIMKGNTIAPACLSTNTGVGMPAETSCNTCHSGNNLI